jgi:hypothetical protein
MTGREHEEIRARAWKNVTDCGQMKLELKITKFTGKQGKVCLVEESLQLTFYAISCSLCLMEKISSSGVTYQGMVKQKSLLFLR